MFYDFLEIYKVEERITNNALIKKLTRFIGNQNVLKI